MYLLDIKKIVNTLETIGSPITSDKHIKVILDDLSNEYDTFVTYVTSRIDPIV